MAAPRSPRVTRSHVIFRAPTQEDFNTFAGEFWDVWEEGEGRENWCDNAARTFVARFPQADLEKSRVFFRTYWNANIEQEQEEQQDTTMLAEWISNSIRLYHREVERWWSAFCDEIRDEGVKQPQQVQAQAFERFTQQYHRALWSSDSPLKEHAEDKLDLTRRTLAVCEQRYGRCVL